MDSGTKQKKKNGADQPVSEDIVPLHIQTFLWRQTRYVRTQALCISTIYYEYSLSLVYLKILLEAKKEVRYRSRRLFFIISFLKPNFLFFYVCFTVPFFARKSAKCTKPAALWVILFQQPFLNNDTMNPVLIVHLHPSQKLKKKKRKKTGARRV